ncbi:hypothetical protein MK280_18530 [Myxococcota bacterium]|nr:hypothetical protein [Myxococcota bacterium]
MEKNRCGRMEILARDEENKLARCSCGSLHLALPYATLHFTESQLLALSRLVNAGLEAIRTQTSLPSSEFTSGSAAGRGPLQ